MRKTNHISLVDTTKQLTMAYVIIEQSEENNVVKSAGSNAVGQVVQQTIKIVPANHGNDEA